MPGVIDVRKPVKLYMSEMVFNECMWKAVMMSTICANGLKRVKIASFSHEALVNDVGRSGSSKLR